MVAVCGAGIRKAMLKPSAQKPSLKVVAVGALMLDLLCRVDNLPQAGEGVVVSSSHAVLGGCAFNSAEILRQLGIPCELLAPTGQGMFAYLAQEQLAARGVDIWLPPTPSPEGTPADCGACICLVTPDGQRTMITLPGIERHFQQAWFEEAPTHDVALAFCSGYEIDGAGGFAILDYLNRIRQQSPDAVIIYAAGPRIASVSDEKLRRILELDAIWHINDQEAFEFSGCQTIEAAGCALVQQTQNIVIVTAGAQGAYIFEPDPCSNQSSTCVHIPTTPVEVVDTVGAGDAHLGALIAGYSCGMTWPDAVSFANQISALVCQNAGATIPDSQLVNFYQMLHERQH